MRTQQLAVFPAVGAALIGAWVAASPHIGSMAGLPADFWRGFPIGMIISMQLFAVVIIMRRKRSER